MGLLVPFSFFLHIQIRRSS
jgi:hypothetical protein